MENKEKLFHSSGQKKNIFQKTQIYSFVIICREENFRGVICV